MKHLRAAMAAERHNLYASIEGSELSMEGFADTLAEKFSIFKKKLGIGSADQVEAEFHQRREAATDMVKALKAIRADVAKANFKETTKAVNLASRLRSLNIAASTPEEVVKGMQTLRNDVKKTLAAAEQGREYKRPELRKDAAAAPAMKMSKEQILQIIDAGIGMAEDYAAATSASEASKIAKKYEDKKGELAQEGILDAIVDGFLSALFVVARVVFTVLIIVLILTNPILFLFGVVTIAIVSNLWKAYVSDDD